LRGYLDHKSACGDSDGCGEEEVVFVMISLLSALLFLSSHSISHNDIKPENIMFDSEVSEYIAWL